MEASALVNSHPQTINNNPRGASRLPWSVWGIGLLTLALQLIRVLNVHSATGEVPFHSANDRSRWCTIAALAIQGNYEIDDVIELRDPQSRRRTWYTIDLVRHRGQDGQQHYYSSKPPLLPTIFTGAYLSIRQLTGLSIMQDTFAIAKIMLVVVNLIPWIAMWYLLMRLAERENLGTLGLNVLALFLGCGTFLSTFANTLNNHLPAAIAVAVSLWALYQILVLQDAKWWWFAVCGLATSFAAANELPALSWLAAAGGLLIVLYPRQTLTVYAPSLLPVAIAFFLSNYLAHGEWSPAYAHRGLGKQLCTLEELQIELSQATPEQLVASLMKQGIACSTESQLRRGRRDGIFELFDPRSQQRWGLKMDANNQIGVYEWRDWYDYPNSYWTSQRKQGVDRGEPNRGIYIVHCLIGHHGIFSLTPFWCVSLLGAVGIWTHRARGSFLWLQPRLWLMLAITATSCVSIGFYLARPLEDRNYGGVSSGFRWAFWLTPLWVWLAIHGLREIRSKPVWTIVCALLAISLFSANYPWDNPWTSPWIMQLMQHWGWISTT